MKNSMSFIHLGLCMWTGERELAFAFPDIRGISEIQTNLKAKLCNLDF